MGYRIIYCEEPELRRRTGVRSLRLRAMIAVGLFVFSVLVRISWPEGTTILTKIFMTEQLTGAEAAFSEMITQLHEGTELTDAVTTFCRNVLDAAS